MIEIHFIMAFFSNFVAFGEKKLINLVFTLTLVLILEKRAANLIRMRKIALSTKIGLWILTSNFTKTVFIEKGGEI